MQSNIIVLIYRKNIPVETTTSTMSKFGKLEDDGLRPFFNKNANTNSNLARLMVRNDTGVPPSKSDLIAESGSFNLKGKVSLKHEKTEQELIQEKMIADLEEKERLAREERLKNAPERQPRDFKNSGFTRGPREDGFTKDGPGFWNSNKTDEDKTKSSWGERKERDFDREKRDGPFRGNPRDRNFDDEETNKKLAARFGDDFSTVNKGRTIQSTGQGNSNPTSNTKGSVVSGGRSFGGLQ